MTAFVKDSFCDLSGICYNGVSSSTGFSLAAASQEEDGEMNAVVTKLLREIFQKSKKKTEAVTEYHLCISFA